MEKEKVKEKEKTGVEEGWGRKEVEGRFAGGADGASAARHTSFSS
jgi:hypothetical protein